jgi:hypothetical protein
LQNCPRTCEFVSHVSVNFGTNVAIAAQQMESEGDIIAWKKRLRKRGVNRITDAKSYKKTSGIISEAVLSPSKLARQNKGVERVEGNSGSCSCLEAPAKTQRSPVKKGKKRNGTQVCHFPLYS